MAKHSFEENWADPMDFNIEIGIDYSINIYEDREDGNYSEYVRIPRLYINGKLYDFPSEISERIQEIIAEHYESINYE